MGEFRMPSLGADMDVGTIVEWRVAVGDVVARGDVIAVVSTEKSDIDIEVFEDGVIEEVLVPQGVEVPVGTALARIRPTEEMAPRPTPAPGTPPAPAPAPTPAPAAVPAPAAAATSTPPTVESRVHSPLVRKLAEQHHVDLDHLDGTGPGGTITRADVEQAVARASGTEPSPPSAGPGDRVWASPLARSRARAQGLDLTELTGSGPDGAIVAADLDAARPTPQDREPTPAGAPAGAPPDRQPATRAAVATGDDRRASLRRAVGELMARSTREIPHYYLDTTIDLHAATAWLRTVNAERTVAERILPAAVLLRAVAVACGSNPAMNGHWIDGAFRPSEDVHLGVAISLRGGGLVAPAITSAQDLTVDELMARLHGLVERARAGRLRASEMTDPTITVTNLGDQGTDAVFGVIYPPQVALVGFGRIAERPWAVDGMLDVRPVVTATLAADHRVSDGHDGATFLTKIDRLLQHPEDL